METVKPIDAEAQPAAVALSLSCQLLVVTAGRRSHGLGGCQELCRLCAPLKSVTAASGGASFLARVGLSACV